MTLIGVGLLGGSLGMALRERRLAGRVTGYVRREASVQECERCGAVDQATVDLLEAVEGADLVVFCTPIAQMAGIAREIAPRLKKGSIVTDVGSVKSGVVRQLGKVIGKAGGHFVGSHPMAGAEKTGVSAGRPDLYEKAVCVVTPTPGTDPGALERIEGLWRSVGARVLSLSPSEHDRLVSRSSHLPHVVAAELVNFVLGSARGSNQADLCASGFRDTTRIASGSPEMWRDIALANHKNLHEELTRFVSGLQEFMERLKVRDEVGVHQFFLQAKSTRDTWAARGLGIQATRSSGVGAAGGATTTPE
ncbi:MAG: prephenate dehydrogenase [Verrucomicrobiota bacterium]